MTQTVLIFFMAFYMIYIITFQIPKRINELENRIDTLNKQLKEINLKLISISDREKVR